jgi:hypothetical protein
MEKIHHKRITGFDRLMRLEKMPFYCSQWRCCDNLVIRVLLLWLGLGSSLGERREKDCLICIGYSQDSGGKSLALAGPRAKLLL